MRAKLLNDADERTYALIFDTDDEVVVGLEVFAREHAIGASRFTAIGALRRAAIGYSIESARIMSVSKSKNRWRCCL